MKYTTIRWVLRNHIKNGVNTLWNWNKEEMNFICLFNSFSDKLPIYTAQQLLDILNEKETGTKTDSKET